MTDFETALRTIMAYYTKYADDKGIKERDFKKMIPTDLHHMLQDAKIKKKVEEMFQMLDQNRDKVIDFDEYWGLMETIVESNFRNKVYQQTI